MLINIVALEMLKSKMPEYLQTSSPPSKPGVSLKLHSASSDEVAHYIVINYTIKDPYSLSPSGSSGSSGQGPRLQEGPAYYGPQTWALGQVYWYVCLTLCHVFSGEEEGELPGPRQAGQEGPGYQTGSVILCLNLITIPQRILTTMG